jgi:gamma-glutamyltranspeptidase/glutathione hydrolase
MAITGKPLAATAGAKMFERGGNAVDAACAMLAATSTMWDVLSWGGETQALIYNPKTGQDHRDQRPWRRADRRDRGFFKSKSYKYPPDEGPSPP